MVEANNSMVYRGDRGDNNCCSPLATVGMRATTIWWQLLEKTNTSYHMFCDQDGIVAMLDEGLIMEMLINFVFLIHFGCSKVHIINRICFLIGSQNFDQNI